MTETPASIVIDTFHETYDAQKIDEVLDSDFNLLIDCLNDDDEDRALENVFFSLDTD